MSDFGERIDFLKEAVGTGHLEGEVEVDQVYAHYQHEHPEFEHPDGGKAYYLRDPLYSGVDFYMQHMADEVITEEGSELTEAMIGNMEDLSKQVEIQAPKEFEDLDHSGHPMVIDDGVKVYDRPPLIKRLSEADLKLKSKIRDITDPHRYRGSWG